MSAEKPRDYFVPADVLNPFYASDKSGDAPLVHVIEISAVRELEQKLSDSTELNNYDSQIIWKLKDKNTALEQRIEKLREALENAEEKFYQAWIKNEGFDDEQSKHDLFEIVYEGREETKEAIAADDKAKENL